MALLCGVLGVLPTSRKGRNEPFAFGDAELRSSGRRVRRVFDCLGVLASVSIVTML